MWHSRLRTQCCYCSSSGHGCGMGLIPVLGTLRRIKKKKKKKKENERLTSLFMRAVQRCLRSWAFSVCPMVFHGGITDDAIFFFFFNFFVFLPFLRPLPEAYGGSQAGGRIGAVAADLPQSHSNTRSLTH